MSAKRQMTGLIANKRLLVLEADLHRALLQTECASLGARLSRARQAVERTRAASPLIAASAAGIGILAAGRWRRLARWIPVTLAALRWVRKFKTE